MMDDFEYAAGDPLAARPFLQASDFAERCYVTYSTVLEGGLERNNFFNGRLLSGAHPYETIAAIIDEELSRTK